MSPHVSVWTNFMPDHMNYYKGDMDRYFADKAAIARFQKAGDVFVTTPEIKEKIEARSAPLAGTCITDAALPADSELSLPGEHNRSNAALAAAAARALGVPDEIIKKVLKEFRGLPGRLAYLGEKNGIKFYNDSNATTPGGDDRGAPDAWRCEHCHRAANCPHCRRERQAIGLCGTCARDSKGGKTSCIAGRHGDGKTAGAPAERFPVGGGAQHGRGVCRRSCGGNTGRYCSPLPRRRKLWDVQERV